MQYFRDRLDSHAINSSIKKLQSKFGSFDTALDDGTQTETFNRARKVVDLVRIKIEAVDPELIAEQALNDLQSYIEQLNVQLAEFAQNKDCVILNQKVDALLNALPMALGGETIESARIYADQISKVESDAISAIDVLRVSAEGVEEKHKKLQGKISQLGQNVDTFKVEITEQKKRVDNIISDQTQQFSARTQERVDEFNALKTRFDKGESERTQKAIDHSNNFSTEQANALAALQESSTNLMAEERSALDKLLEEHRSKADNTKTVLKERLDEAEKIVGLIANTGLTGNYQRVANDENSIANLFRWIAIGIMAACLIFVGVVVYSINLSGANFSWEVALFRISASLPFFVLSYYCGRESTRHRRIEQRNRQIELELASLSPFLAKLSETDRLTIIKDLSNSYFGGHKETEDDDVSWKYKNLRGKDFIKLVEQIAKILK